MNDRRSTHGNVVPLRPANEDSPALPELGHGTGKDFVARLDLAKAQNRLLAMVVAAASTTPEVEAAVERYEALDAEWSANAADADTIPPSQCEMHEVFGAIGHFDVSGGYCFIIPDNGLPDAILHGTTLRASGFSTAPLGARIACQIIETPSGLRVHRVYSMDVSTATPPSELPRDEPYPAVAESPWEAATVMRFDYLRGYGYLASQAQSGLIYCQIETLRRFGFFELRPGQRVQIRCGQTARGPTVAEMRPDYDSQL
jgi:CspA family cold shock protein